MKIPIVPKIADELLNGCTASHRIVAGGRGRGASWSIARILLAEGFMSRQFVACVREFQSSIKNSVKLLLKEQIDLLGLSSHYTISNTEIVGKNGTRFVFYGLQEHNADKFKSLEGITRCWVAEAQSLSRGSVDILRPTIRAEGSVTWWDLNPRYATDAVYADYVAPDNPPRDAAVCWLSMDDNPWATDKMKLQRQADYDIDPGQASHIWEGKLRDSGESFMFPIALVEAAMLRHASENYPGDVYVGADLAHRGGDEIVFYAVNSLGVIGSKVSRKRSAVDTRQSLIEFVDQFKASSVSIDNGNVGAAIADEVQAARPDFIIIREDFGSKPRNRRFKDRAAEMYWNARDMLSNVSIPRDNILRDQLVSRKWLYMGSSEGERIMLEPKKAMQKTPGWNSPDRADALVLALSQLSPGSGTYGTSLGYSIY